VAAFVEVLRFDHAGDGRGLPAERLAGVGLRAWDILRDRRRQWGGDSEQGGQSDNGGLHA
jgi:hypothetical protein